MESLNLQFLLLIVFSDLSFGSQDVYVIETLAGETITLPCNVSTNEGDEAILILWFRDDKGTPIYSVDFRGGTSRDAKRWSDDTIFGNRAYFIFENSPGKLSLQNVKYADSGVYRCRVDFLKAQTSNSRIKLSVVASPEHVIIRDETNAERSTVVGPYSEGDIISLKCEVLGGVPIPTVTWLHDDIQTSSKSIHIPGAKFILSTITLGPLGREDLNSKLKCRATNHPRAAIVEAVVQIDMNFAPLNIRLLGAHQPLSAGRRYDLLCQSAGSRPPAVITWWINGVRLEKTTETTSSDGNQTTSTLSITLSKSDAGKYLSCKAYNSAIRSEALEDGWRLDIQYKPETYVRLGTSLNENVIREGTDVYFDCLVEAHPPVFRIEWRHNDKILPHNVSQGVIVTNHSLVLQGVSRSTAGNYSCVGFNAEGEGSSLPFTLNVLYAPTCAPNQNRIYGIAKQEDAKIKCSVDANPPDVGFSWTFNNSAESIDVASNHILNSGTTSTMIYTPITELDYGTLLCIAYNKIGRQKIPCVFHIIAAGRPDQVHNCTLINVSMTSLTVTCNDGFNGGLPQLFAMELKDAHTSEIKANITSTIPRFTVSTLIPGSGYTLSIYAFNSKGRSDPIVFNAVMLRMPEKQHTTDQSKKRGSFMSEFSDKNPRDNFLFAPEISLSIGLGLALLVATLAVILALRIPCKRARRHSKEISRDNLSTDGSPGMSDKSTASKDMDEMNESDDKNPDVVPGMVGSDVQVEHIRNGQNISTINSCHSPHKDVLPSATLPHYCVQSSVNFQTSQSLNYCTLRNEVLGQKSMPIEIVPHVFSKTVAQCTLPRHTSQKVYVNACNDTIGSGNVHPISTFHQLHFPPTKIQGQLIVPQQEIITSSICASQNSTTSNMQSLGRNIALPHIKKSHREYFFNSNTHSKPESNGYSDDEINVQTPLMIKRDSNV